LRVAQLEELRHVIGQELGTTDWVTVTSSRVADFASATGDDHWIHVDADRAANGPFGTPVAHGFLVLALIGTFHREVLNVGDVDVIVNYGLDRVRFVAPLPVGHDVRARARLGAFDEVLGGAQLTVAYTMEDRDAQTICVAQHHTRFYCGPNPD
jgi:acyl dehydratase